MLIPLQIHGEVRRLRIVVGTYRDGNLLVRLVEPNGTPFFKASLTFPGLRLPHGEFAFKTYSENEGLLDAMLAAGVVAFTGRSVNLPTHAGIVPVCKLLPPYDRLPS